MKKYIAVRHRAAGSPSVHFGPFDSLEELWDWASENRLTVAVVELVDPDSPSSTWWA